MNVFVIHSGQDRKIVEGYMSEIKKKNHKINHLILKNGNCFWKIDADRKIKKAQMVIFFVGENSHTSPYIAWEIKRAIKYEKKIYTVKIRDEYQVHPELNRKDKFSKEKYRYDKETTLDGILKIVYDYERGNYKVFNQDLESMDKNVLLEQYKVFLQTSEDLVTRRQNVNSFYISINSALVALFSMLFAFELSTQQRMVIGILFSLVGIVLSVSWIKILVAYGNLNGSKMKIISSVEKQLPASLYDAEWEALSDKLNNKKYVSFTDSEKWIPKIFIAIYACVLIAMLLILLSGWF